MGKFIKVKDILNILDKVYDNIADDNKASKLTCRTIIQEVINHASEED